MTEVFKKTCNICKLLSWLIIVSCSAFSGGVLHGYVKQETRFCNIAQYRGGDVYQDYIDFQICPGKQLDESDFVKLHGADEVRGE